MFQKTETMKHLLLYAVVSVSSFFETDVTYKSQFIFISKGMLFHEIQIIYMTTVSDET